MLKQLFLSISLWAASDLSIAAPVVIVVHSPDIKNLAFDTTDHSAALETHQNLKTLIQDQYSSTEPTPKFLRLEITQPSELSQQLQKQWQPEDTLKSLIFIGHGNSKHFYLHRKSPLSGTQMAALVHDILTTTPHDPSLFIYFRACSCARGPNSFLTTFNSGITHTSKKLNTDIYSMAHVDYSTCDYQSNTMKAGPIRRMLSRAGVFHFLRATDEWLFAKFGRVILTKLAAIEGATVGAAGFLISLSTGADPSTALALSAYTGTIATAAIRNMLIARTSIVNLKKAGEIEDQITTVSEGIPKVFSSINKCQRSLLGQ